MYDELTRSDLQKMQEEIDYRVQQLRPKLIEDVQTARAFGDLSENFEYKCAKQDKNRNDARIRYLQRMIKTARVIEDTSGADTAGLYDTVEIFMENMGKSRSIVLVTTLRQDALKGLISKESPVGRAVLGVLVCAGLIVFTVFEIPVVRDARTDTGAHPNAIIVLGAGVNGSTPSLSMCNRLDAALDYLGANPDALAVVSGGQGEGEDITEAEAMADYLTAHGIDSARIVQEDQSRTTRENLENSFAILRARGYDPADGVGIVTSEYHLCRAKRMARALGAKPVGIAAETTLPSMRINYFIREAFAAAYMQLAGTLY